MSFKKPKKKRDVYKTHSMIRSHAVSKCSKRDSKVTEIEGAGRKTMEFEKFGLYCTKGIIKKVVR